MSIASNTLSNSFVYYVSRRRVLVSTYTLTHTTHIAEDSLPLFAYGDLLLHGDVHKRRFTSIALVAGHLHRHGREDG